MSRMRTSCASFSWARPAIRRACSSGVRVSSGPLGLVISVAAVEAELTDRDRDGRRHELVDWLAARDSRPNLGRRHGRGLEVEREHPVAVALEIRGRIARARPDGQPYPAQYLVRLLPAREGRALVGSDDEDRFAEAPTLDGIDSERVVVEHDLVGESEGGLGEPQARLGGRDDRSVPRSCCY